MASAYPPPPVDLFTHRFARHSLLPPPATNCGRPVYAAGNAPIRLPSGGYTLAGSSAPSVARAYDALRASHDMVSHDSVRSHDMVSGHSLRGLQRGPSAHVQPRVGLGGGWREVSRSLQQLLERRGRAATRWRHCLPSAADAAGCGRPAVLVRAADEAEDLLHGRIGPRAGRVWLGDVPRSAIRRLAEGLPRLVPGALGALQPRRAVPPWQVPLHHSIRVRQRRARISALFHRPVVHSR